MNKALIGGIAAVALAGGFIGYKVLRLRSEAAKWAGPMHEIVEESIMRGAGVTKSRFVSVIDAPIDRVQKILWDVENLENIVPNFKRSTVVAATGNTKLLEVHLQALTLPTLAYEMEFTLHPESHRVTFKTTKSQAQDIEGEYQFESSPDGTKTRLTYMTTARDKVAVALPHDLLDSAGRETFVNTVRGVQQVVNQQPAPRNQ